MGSWWQVELGNQPAPIGGKNRVPDPLMLVFTAGDRFLDRDRYQRYCAFESELERDPDHPLIDPPASWRSHMFGYRATAATLRTRLELQGFGPARVRALAEALFKAEREEAAEYQGLDPRDSWPQGRASYPDGAAVVASLASARGRRAAAAVRPVDREQSFLNSQWERLVESFDDPRFALSMSLMSTRANTVVTLDLTDLVLGGWMEIEDVPHDDARTRMTQNIAASGPVIVVAEGASDARWMRSALQIAAPAVAHLFEFLDFAEYRAPGGTDRVVSLTRGMAAAGVMNRIVAILDNDTAGAAAASQLAAQPLPDRVAVVTLPDVPFGRVYPTLGPEGAGHADVNGRAVSIEFMFGEDVLCDSEVGRPFPVRWQSWIESEGKYQGRLDRTHKAAVAQRLDHALDCSRRDSLTAQIADGCRQLAELLLAAAQPPRHVPASEFSHLAATWRNNVTF